MIKMINTRRRSQFHIFTLCLHLLECSVPEQVPRSLSGEQHTCASREWCRRSSGSPWGSDGDTPPPAPTSPWSTGGRWEEEGIQLCRSNVRRENTAYRLCPRTRCMSSGRGVRRFLRCRTKDRLRQCAVGSTHKVRQKTRREKDPGEHSNRRGCKGNWVCEG